MRKLLFLALILWLASVCASAQTGAGVSSTRRAPSRPPSEIDDLAEALEGKWDIQCMPEGCLMFKDVLRGDPDHPSDPANPEYITIAFAIERNTRQPKFFAFHVPPNADPSQGVFITFGRTVVDTTRAGCSPTAAKQLPRCFRTQLNPRGATRLPFARCSKESCVARVPGGRVEKGPGRQQMDLLENFLSQSLVLFLYVRDGEPFRAMESLSPFQKAYKQLMAKELRAR